MIFGNLGAFLDPSGGCLALAPIPLDVFGALAGWSVHPFLGVLCSKVSGLDNVVMVDAFRAIPVVLGNLLQRRVQAPHMGRVLALLAKELLLWGVLAATNGAAALLAFPAEKQKYF